MAADKPGISRPVYQLIDVIIPHLEKLSVKMIETNKDDSTRQICNI